MDFCNLSLDQLKQVLCDQGMGQTLAGRTGNKRDEIEPVSQEQIQDVHYAKWKPSTKLNDLAGSPNTVLVSLGRWGDLTKKASHKGTSASGDDSGATVFWGQAASASAQMTLHKATHASGNELQSVIHSSQAHLT